MGNKKSGVNFGSFPPLFGLLVGYDVDEIHFANII